MELTDLNPPAIVGEQVAGRAAHVRKKLMMLVGDVNEATFDMAELLYEAVEGNLPQQWGYDDIYDYGETELGLKERKIQYLVRIVTVCTAVGLKRESYEPAGVSKLREITRLDPQGSFFNPETKTPEPLNEHIVDLITDAEKYTGKELLEEVRRLMGQTGGNRPVTKVMSWTEDTYNNVIVPAQELARKRLGSAKRDEQGNAVEYTDSVVEELIHVEFLVDPNNQPEPEEITMEEVLGVPKPFDIPMEAE
jgi:hypothetical protein